MGSCFGLLSRTGKGEDESNNRDTTSTSSGMEINGSVVLITGGARGLGRAFAEILLAKGAKVCILDIDGKEGEATVQELQATHGSDNVAFVLCDVTKDQCFKDAWDSASEKLGPVNLLINNAGIGNEQNWQLTMEINVGGCMRGSLLALEKLGTNKGGKGGNVVNISSIVGLKVNPFGPIYSASKHAIVGLTRSLGHDFHLKVSGVKVQALCPSLVRTELLANSVKNAFSPEVAQAMSTFASAVKDMKAETVANALVKLLEEGKNGGCLVVEADKDPYYVDSPI